MSAHTLDNLYEDIAGDWVAECACHNPDGDGTGRADFRAETALDAVHDWQLHCDLNTVMLTTAPYPRRTNADAGVCVSVEHGLKDDYPYSLQIMSPHGLVWADLTADQWASLRGE